MTNNKQQTAVEWQFEQLFNSFEKFNNGEYTFDEYLSSNLRIREQAKEMEKQKVIDAHYGYIQYLKRLPKDEYLPDFEQWYEQSNGGGEQ